MTSPTPDQVVQAQLGAQAADLGGSAQPAASLDVSGATPATADAAELLARLQALEAAAEASKPAEPEPPSNAVDEVLDGSVAAQFHTLAARVEARLKSIEQHLGL
jgi:hypothetical protein